MDEFLEDRIYETAYLCGFITCFDWEEDYVTFEAHSPLGEDISFDVDYDETPFNEDEYISDRDAYFFKVIVRELKYMGMCFNVEEHAVMLWETHKKSEAPTDLRTLLNDAQAIKNMYGYLYIQMYSLKEKMEEEWLQKNSMKEARRESDVNWRSWLLLEF